MAAPAMKRCGRLQRLHFARWIALALALSLLIFHHGAFSSQLLPIVSAQDPDGPECVVRGKQLFSERKYDAAATELWNAVLHHGLTPPDRTYDVTEVFGLFMQCYVLQGKIGDGLAFVASESFRRGQNEMGQNYLQQALEAEPENAKALAVQEEFAFLALGQTQDAHSGSRSSAKTSPANEFGNTIQQSNSKNKDLEGKTPEQLYEIAAKHFSDKNYDACADIAEMSCIRSNYQLGPSCANAVYCRNSIVDFGFNGTQFDRDMIRLVTLTKSEKARYRHEKSDGSFEWKRALSIHPHMMLGFPVDSTLKRYVTESVAYLDELMARASRMSSDGSIPPLPDGLPYNTEVDRIRMRQEVAAVGDSHRIRVGFVGSGFNSKAVLFLSQDMFRFFNASQFEIHIFSFGSADHPDFIQHGMRGVDWRERVKRNVEYFHDCQALHLEDHVSAARYIHDQNIHILIEWDGYARQGDRAQGLFALRPAPIQILHQEYIGTSGALYVDYLFSDVIASPPHLEHLYTEKLIRLPNHFFSKGHAYQDEVNKPADKYLPKNKPYKLGTGSPSENRCLSPASIGPEQVSFVFCNFNKLLKTNPETIRSWIRILREVPDSILCLLENPREAVPYFRKFVHEAAGTSVNHSDPTTFEPGDGEELNQRIHFLPWERNPFDHQARNRDFCNVMLDSHPYNGHTVAQDALYAGVPIVTRSDGDDMSSRVTTSGNTVLGLEALNARNGVRDYEDIAIRIGTDSNFYSLTRAKLIDSCLQRNPMHPYWDVARYVKNFESGLQTAWSAFLDGQQPNHIQVKESPLAALGTFDDEILRNPTNGKREKLAPTEKSISEEL